MRLVVDASVAVKWFLSEKPDEQNVEEAAAILRAIDEQGADLFAPAHWDVEVMSVISRLDREKVEPALVLLSDLNPAVIGDTAVLRAAARMSVTLNHHLFDTLYHAVALDVGATLVTADRVYFDKAASLGGIMLLADFRAPG